MLRSRFFVFVVAMVIAAGLQATCRAQSSLSARNYADQIAEQRIRAALSQRVILATNGYTLDALVLDLSAVTGVRFVLDQRHLQEAGIVSNQPTIGFNLAGMVLQNGLDLLLQDLDCTWLIKGDTVVITTKTAAETNIEIRVYPVLDLVVIERGTHYTDDYESLMQLITSTIHPTTWSCVGGTGSLEPYSGSGAIVVSQTREVHDQLELLLDSLRQVRDAQGLKSHLKQSRAAVDRALSRSYQASAHIAAVDNVPAYAGTASAPTWQVPRVYSE